MSAARATKEILDRLAGGPVPLVLEVRPGPGGTSGLPLTRAALLPRPA